MRSTHRVATLAALLAGMLAGMLAGCGTGHDPPPAATSDSAEPGVTHTVEELAAAVGCTPRPGGKGKDFRQASCTSDGDNFVFLQFDEPAGEEDWLAYAVAYGGVYLAGDRWVLAGRSEEYLKELQEELGGEIRKADR